MPAWLERMLLRHVPYVLDFDDAIFHNYDRHAWWVIRTLWARRIDRLMAGARLVVAGNEYLARRARDAGAPWVEVVPTVVDLDRYVAVTGDEAPRQPPRVVWIGSPGTLRYLEGLGPALAELSRRQAFVLRVVGGRLSVPGVVTECLEWTEGGEAAAIANCDVGIMPLTDTPWERGKCGYKLIQYMACGLPVVASPVGVNAEIVRDGENGFLAPDARAWVDSLGCLLSDAPLRRAMGRKGRERVQERYSLQQVAPRLAALLQVARSRNRR
jgi:glycosyltransferase involved in cell wall biosynthesis